MYMVQSALANSKIRVAVPLLAAQHGMAPSQHPMTAGSGTLVVNSRRATLAVAVPAVASKHLENSSRGPQGVNKQF